MRCNRHLWQVIPCATGVNHSGDCASSHAVRGWRGEIVDIGQNQCNDSWTGDMNCYISRYTNYPRK